MVNAEDHPFDGVDLRAEPQKYQIGRGEYGVFHAQPYKSELMPLWRFRIPDVARESAAALYAKFAEYRAAGDFVGMDVARKYIQMGWTRARRYANHRGGRKYDDGGNELPRSVDAVKAASAAVFAEYLARVKADAVYLAAKQQFQNQ